MSLRTLGGLRLEGSSFRREKPLLLVVYLALEGTKARRTLAELFWSEGKNPMVNLADALRKAQDLKLIEKDDQRAWVAPNVVIDVLEWQQLIEQDQLEAALDLYQGDFLERAELEQVSSDLQEWVEAKAIQLANTMQQALITQATREASKGAFSDAAHWAHRAYRLPGTLSFNPDLLPQTHAILVAGHHADAETVRLEAEELGLILKLDAEMARRQLRQQFLGRQQELERLKSLEPGEWAWVQGASGMGKTSLLRQLAPQATYLLARQGLPLATLEPLLGAKITEGNTVMLRYLSRLEGLILLDGWEFMDSESQELIANWRTLHSPARVIIASNQTLPFALNTTLKLQFLGQTELELVPEVFERTGGVPSLVGAFLRGEPLESILEQRLKILDENTRNLLAGLTLLERPRLPLLARIFNLSAISLDTAKQALVTQGLIDLAGNVRALEAAQHWLEALPQLTATIVTELAPHLSPLEAFPLYQKIFGIVPKEQLAHYQAAALAWAKESLHRGRPIVALQALEHLPNDPEVALTRARIHEQAGAYKQALETLPAGDTSSIAALRSALLVRLGHPEEAKVAAERALEGEPRDRAEGLNTLAHIEMAAGNLEAAKDYFRRSALLWLMAEEPGRYAYSLNNIAVVLAKAGQPSETAFEKALQAAGDHPTLRASVLLNRGMALEQMGKLEESVKHSREAAQLAEAHGAMDTASRAWNNVAIVYHNQDKKDIARDAYHKALKLAHDTNEVMLLASILANLSELDDDAEALEESIRLLEESGHTDVAARYQGRLEAFKDRSREVSQA